MTALLLLVVVLLLSKSIVDVQAVDNNQDNIEGNPDGYDKWCKEHCSSFVLCSRKYGDDFVDLRVKTDYSILDGPGKHLIHGSFLGDTISRQTFDTQFALDIATSVAVSPCRVHVIEVMPETDEDSWDIENVFVTFRIFPAEIALVQQLTLQIQDTASKFYDGKVTSASDRLFGLVALKWDLSLKLTYSINIVGGSSVEDLDGIYYLNQGSERWCKDENNASTEYCEFERYFQDDIAQTLMIGREQVDILFIKKDGEDSVIVSFRLLPEISMASPYQQDAHWIEHKVTRLINQVNDIKSELYRGNVTFRVDMTWGVSNDYAMQRNNTSYIHRPLQDTVSDTYERCKESRTCSRGWSYYNQSTALNHYTMQSFPGGEHIQIPLFADFEDWRQGTQGWEQSCSYTSEGDACVVGTKKSIYDVQNGAHWSPFDFFSLGPITPSFNSSSNNGLVLNKASLTRQIAKQAGWINEIEEYIEWLDDAMQSSSLDVDTRSREDIQHSMMKTQGDYRNLLSEEKRKLVKLSSSQCMDVSCDLIFNTSSLLLSGAINATGSIAITPDGTEVAVWAFDSIDVAKEVNVTLTGQRALALLSRSSVRIDTTFHAYPGTLGGFPGGYSVFRHANDRLVSICIEGVESRGFGDICGDIGTPCCPYDQPISKLKTEIPSNNVNGPGSGSVRVYLKTIETIAPIANEIQTITTDAYEEQVLGGGFKLHFNGYTTPFLPHDVTARELKRAMEDSLNAAKLSRLHTINRSSATPGIGRVNISRIPVGTSGGYKWTVTFSTAVGDVGGVDSGQLTATNLLNGMGASLSIKTITEGNSIGGNFFLNFLGSKTRPLRHDISANDLQTALLEDIESLRTAHVTRSDPTNSCNDGFCENGPQRAGGYIWTVSLTTHVNNVSPSSPTSKEFDFEGDIVPMTAISQLTGCVASVCPSIRITDGHQRSTVDIMKTVKVTKPFSLSYGGAGAGHGGAGGEGFGGNGPGQIYGDKNVTNLYGGSGGALGFTQPFEAVMYNQPRGRGGSGGGAIEIVALNDIVLGPNSVLTCDGERGSDGHMTAGGGGSGGTILLSAGSTVHNEGIISAAGGNGGTAMQPQGRSDIPDGHGGGGGGGRVAVYGQSIATRLGSKIVVDGGLCTSRDVTYQARKCNGRKGTVYKDESLRQEMYVDFSEGGAVGTAASLHLRGHAVRVKMHPSKRTSALRSGPEYDLGRLQRPGRVSFFVRVQPESAGSRTSWGASFELRDRRWSDIASDTERANYTAVLGLMIGTNEMRYGSNYRGMPYDTSHLKTMDILYKGSGDSTGRWQKVDVRLDWGAKQYDIYLDDVLIADRSSFRTDQGGIRTIALSNYRPNGSVWFDEIFLGMDDTMGFKCPILKSLGKVEMTRPIQRGWKVTDLGETGQLHEMKRHSSHLSRRPLYSHADGGNLVPFDGIGHRMYTSDLKFRSSHGDHDDTMGKFLAGSLLQVPSTQENPKDVIFGKVPDTYVWYGDHDNILHNKTGEYSSKDGYLSWVDGDHVHGGVFACSTKDFMTWKNLGQMLNYANLTDMVNGLPEPFRVERPKVLYNAATDKYVMWMTLENGNVNGNDNNENNLGMSAVAVSNYPEGPFQFVRSLYPDGNRTRDQTVVQDKADKDGGAYLIRTYYASIEYILPSPVMQPIWESVKNADGTINFALSHHRAVYEPGYDDYHDIYLQRWRMEDQPWQIICVNRITGMEREVPYGADHLNFDGEICNDPMEEKIVLGQGSPLHHEAKQGVSSRFLDPNDPSNSAWMPNSVPGVKAQPWSANYEDGTCGKRRPDDDLHRLDPTLPDRHLSDRASCSNIADNPTHNTRPDMLIGPDQVIETRRAKFVAISRLTYDYLDTSGILHSYEGELEDGMDLLSLVRGLVFNEGGVKEKTRFEGGDHTIGGKNRFGSTYQHQIHDADNFRQSDDWEHRFHQYVENYNDRAYYSTACVLDGRCPINFRDQLLQK